MKVKISKAIRLVTAYIKANLVPIVRGSPGIGKSDIVHQVAKHYNLKVIDIRLAQCDPTDLNGFPQINGKKASYLPMDTFPLEGEPLPEGYAGWLLFFDELTSAVPAIQAAAYKILLDRKIGQFNLHKNVAMVAAGNLETDNAVVQPMSTAMQSRLAHMELICDPSEWTDWAASNNVDHRISDFIKFKPGMVYTFSPDHTDDTYACPRTWAGADRLLKGSEPGDPDLLEKLAGTISEGVAREFIAFTKIYESLPSIEKIIASPMTIPVSEEPSILFALTGSISHNMKADNCEELLKYVNRIPPEFQVVCLRETVRRNKPLLSNKAVQKWIADSAASLF